MAPKTNRQATAAGAPRGNSCQVSVFIFIVIFFLIMGDGFSSSAESLKTVDLSNTASSAMLESMPLWGGRSVSGYISAGKPI